MILRQILHRNPVGLSCLFGCGGHATGAVADSAGGIEPYRRAAREAAELRAANSGFIGGVAEAIPPQTILI